MSKWFLVTVALGTIGGSGKVYEIYNATVELRMA
jgi:hypothetical protein